MVLTLKKIGVTVGSLVFAGIGFWLFWNGITGTIRAIRLGMADSVPPAEVSAGAVAVEGTVQTGREGTLAATLLDEDGVVVDTRVQRPGADPDSWSTMYTESRAQPFLVTDGVGTVRVDPPDCAEIILEHRWTTLGEDESPPERVQQFVAQFDSEPVPGFDLLDDERRRFGQGVVKPGDELFVYGTATRRDAAELVVTGDDLFITDMSEHAVAGVSAFGGIMYLIVGLWIAGIGLGVAGLIWFF